MKILHIPRSKAAATLRNKSSPWSAPPGPRRGTRSSPRCRKKVLRHKGTDYLAYGLSEAATHPDCQKRGLATQTIQRAARFMLSQGPDISIFTCAREKAAFYTRCGWQAVPGACLVSGTREKPFSSGSLNLVTMMAFLSSKGKAHREDFEHTDIFLELGENQLW